MKTDPIPVRILRFVLPMDGPGLSVASSCTGSPKPVAQRHWRIDFWPSMRHFRIAYYANSNEAPTIGFIHEAQVKSWEPIEAVEVPPGASGPAFVATRRKE